MLYLYESHMGGIYFSDGQIYYESLYCEICGDSDYLLGYFNSCEEVLAAMADNIDLEDGLMGSLDIEILLGDLTGYFDTVPSLKEAKKIVKKNRSMERRS